MHTYTHTYILTINIYKYFLSKYPIVNCEKRNQIILFISNQETNVLIGIFF